MEKNLTRTFRQHTYLGNEENKVKIYRSYLKKQLKSEQKIKSFVMAKDKIQSQ